MRFPERMISTIDIGELAYSFRHALQEEDYEWCGLLHTEVAHRIAMRDEMLIWAIDAAREPALNWGIDWCGLNGLFEGLREVYPEEFEPWAPLLYQARLCVKYSYLYAKEAD